MAPSSFDKTSILNLHNPDKSKQSHTSRNNKSHKDQAVTENHIEANRRKSILIKANEDLDAANSDNDENENEKNLSKKIMAIQIADSTK